MTIGWFLTRTRYITLGDDFIWFLVNWIMLECFSAGVLMKRLTICFSNE